MEEEKNSTLNYSSFLVYNLISLSLGVRRVVYVQMYVCTVLRVYELEF